MLLDPKQVVIYIDMDDTLVQFTEGKNLALANNPAQPWPQSQIGFFVGLKPLPGAVNAYKWLKGQGFRVMFLTAPSVMNPLCYTEKRLSIERLFGFDACQDLIIATDKSLLCGDILIDDRIDSNRQQDFKGKLIHFGSLAIPDWNAALRAVDQCVTSMCLSKSLTKSTEEPPRDIIATEYTNNDSRRPD